MSSAHYSSPEIYCLLVKGPFFCGGLLARLAGNYTAEFDSYIARHYFLIALFNLPVLGNGNIPPHVPELTMSKLRL